MATKQRVGFIGLGSMGVGMASNLQTFLQRKSHDSDVDSSLVVYNRSAGKAHSLLEQGCSWGESPAKMAQSCSLVFAMLAEDNALTEVFNAYLSGKPPAGSIFVDCSTVYPDTTVQLAKQAADAGVGYLSCPVFGRPQAAAAKKLLVVASGPPEHKRKALQYLEAMGRGVMDVGNDVKQGSVMKLVGNFYIAATIEIIAEGMTLADKSGLHRDHLLTFFQQMFPGPVFEGYGERIACSDFAMDPENPGFTVALAQKDVGHMQKLAQSVGAPLPTVDTVMQHLKAAQAAGRGSLDWGAIATVLRDQAAIDNHTNGNLSKQH